MGWVICAAVVSASSYAQSPKTADAPELKRPSRSERLRQWVDALERHEPGFDDDALGVFDTWRRDDFAYLTIDINTLLQLIADPDLRTFSFVPPGRVIPIHVAYKGSDLRLILELAKTARSRGTREGEVISRERIARNRNHVLKRGAILHTDVALVVLREKRPSGRSVPEGTEQFTLQMPDGRSQGMSVNVGHWNLARALLDRIAPAPTQDEFVRRWYSATSSYLEGIAQLTPMHFTRGLGLFPDDAGLLFLAGCLHEALAQARVQEAIQGAAIPTDVTFDVASARAELRESESLLRKALKAQPNHLEARIHLGRVLGLRGEHGEAEKLLGKAVADAKEPLLQYYAKLFLGAEKEALGDRVQARNLYHEAALLYPEAQSPRLALGLLYSVDGKHDDAVAAMSVVLGSPSERRNEPWWTYHYSQGRNAPDELAAAYADFLDEDRR
jgi:tetratricopeptide (TPR) repeat protein